MPRNRSERSREEKSAEIVEIAQRLFLAQGYDGTTMAAVAREAGVASNVVHWYFPTKDELFVAVMEALQRKDMQQAAEKWDALTADDTQKGQVEVLSDFVCRRLDRYSLISTLHERSQHSEAVARFHDQVHQRYEQALESVLERSPMPVAERKLVVDAFVTVIEGLIMHRVSKREARRMMAFLAERLIPSS